MTLEDIRDAVRRSRSTTMMADAFREALGMAAPRATSPREIPFRDFQSYEERRQVREAMFQRYGALDRP